MSKRYTDGPPNQPWEVEPDATTFWVQRVGWNERNHDVVPSTEQIFSVPYLWQAHLLAEYLNELDRLRAMAHVARQYRQAIEVLDGVHAAEQALLAALKELD